MKLIIDIPDEEYKTLSELSEKEKVNELSYYERIIANGTPYEERSTGEWINQDFDDLKISDYRCNQCGHYQDDITNFCSNCGSYMKGGAE